jgi:Flp pilus assembly protein TadD
MSFDCSKTLRSAERHLSRGRITGAIEEYRKLVKWDSTDLTTLNTLGDLCARVGLYEEAKLIFSRVAQGYRRQGSTPKAIALLKKLLRIDPTDLDSAAQLADCYLAQGLRGDAGRQYADVADAYRRAGREDKALDAYQRMAEIVPSNASLLAAGRLDDAERTFQKLIVPDSGEHRNLPVVEEKLPDDGGMDRAVEQIDGFVDALIANRDDQEALHFQFVAAAEILGMTPFSQQNISIVSAGAIHGMTPVSEESISSGTTDFEVVAAENRRRTARVSTRVPLVVISDAGGWREFTETVDVSEVGLKLHLAHRVAPTTVLGVSIDFAKWPETVARIPAMNAKRCIVRYCRQSTAECNLVGVELRCILEQTACAASPSAPFTHGPSDSV